MAVTISDIAKHVGVTIATVSKVLNNSPSGYTISDKTRKKVYAAVKELNYRPNYLSRALVGGKSKTIGLVINPVMFATPIHALRLAAIEKTAQQAGYFIYIVGKPFQNEAEPIQGLLDRRVDGLVVYFATEPSRKIMDLLNAQTLPIVYVDWAPPGCSRWIKINRARGIEQVAEHLVRLGHRHIRYVPHQYDFDQPEGKLNYYRQAFAGHGIDLAVARDFSISPTGDIKVETIDIVHRLIASNQLPTALILSNDYAALSAVSALQDAGIKVPEQISVVGFDNLDFADVVRPSLTTVRQPVERAASAFEMLLELMNGPVREVSTVDLPCELVVRQSTGPAPRR